ncbi:MAG: hypothetical protein Q8808_02605 [Candidatus Phytoplasma australasiaticum]|nr:hypothetical protein [Candidatus Phytoplasma australasiaticum]
MVLEELLKMEEMLWRVKVKTRWLGEDDANTHFFYLSTIIHRRYNSINQILSSDNSWLTNWIDIGEEFQMYYTQIFATYCPSFPNDLNGLFQPCLTFEHNRTLMIIPSGRNSQHAIFSMGSFKSPGPDGMTFTFYKKYWNIVGPKVMEVIQDIFRTRKLPSSFNNPFIALIPKANHASKVDQFRPILLCNVVFKVVTKIMDGRIQGLLEGIIHHSHAAFVPNRSIGDNSIINHEVMHYLKRK